MSATETVIQDFIATFARKHADPLAPFFHDDIFFANHVDPDVRGKDNVVQVWKYVFETFEAVRFEIINQAINGSTVLMEQFHHLALPGRETAPIRNMAVYEIQDGKNYSLAGLRRQQVRQATAGCR